MIFRILFLFATVGANLYKDSCDDVSCPIGTRCRERFVLCGDRPCMSLGHTCEEYEDIFNPCLNKNCPSGLVCKNIPDVRFPDDPSQVYARCLDPNIRTDCALNEYLSFVGGCDATCDRPRPVCRNSYQTKHRCLCKPGFYRYWGQCVTAHFCRMLAIGHEIFKK